MRRYWGHSLRGKTEFLFLLRDKDTKDDTEASPKEDDTVVFADEQRGEWSRAGKNIYQQPNYHHGHSDNIISGHRSFLQTMWFQHYT